MIKNNGADSPKEICFRHVYNDVVCGAWVTWEDPCDNKISAEDFIMELEKRNMDPENLSINAFPDDNGIIIDYGLRLQFWIPNTAWKHYRRDIEFIKNFIK